MADCARIAPLCSWGAMALGNRRNATTTMFHYHRQCVLNVDRIFAGRTVKQNGAAFAAIPGKPSICKETALGVGAMAANMAPYRLRISFLCATAFHKIQGPS